MFLHISSAAIFMFAALFSFQAAAACTVSPQAVADRRVEIQKQFDLYDLDHDGLLSLTEYLQGESRWARRPSRTVETYRSKPFAARPALENDGSIDMAEFGLLKYPKGVGC